MAPGGAVSWVRTDLRWRKVAVGRIAERCSMVEGRDREEQVAIGFYWYTVQKGGGTEKQNKLCRFLLVVVHGTGGGQKNSGTEKQWYMIRYKGRETEKQNKSVQVFTGAQLIPSLFFSATTTRQDCSWWYNEDICS